MKRTLLIAAFLGAVALPAFAEDPPADDKQPPMSTPDNGTLTDPLLGNPPSQMMQRSGHDCERKRQAVPSS